MDCRSHTWHEAPSKRVARKYPIVSVLDDGKIYVVEQGKACDPSKLIECFDPKTQIWEHVPSPGVEVRGRCILRTLAIDGNLYLLGDKDHVVYKPKENKWDVVKSGEMLLGLLDSIPYCVIDKVLYRYRWSRWLGGVTERYDSEKRSWTVLKGLEELPELPPGHNYGCVRFVNYGGNMVLSWDEDVCATGSNKKKIWCAEIELEKRNGQEIRGKVKWCNVVLKVPKSRFFKHLKLLLPSAV